MKKIKRIDKKATEQQQETEHTITKKRKIKATVEKPWFQTVGSKGVDL
jgi:hypothetical protein